jgi:prevent-host-death family protein
MSAKHAGPRLSFNIHEAQAKLSYLLKLVASGTSVTIARAGRPIAVLNPHPSSQTRRGPGGTNCEITMSDDCFAALSGKELEGLLGKK